MALCDRCQAINLLQLYYQSIPPDPSSLPAGWVHSDTYASLKSSSVSCPLCAILVGNINPNKQAAINDDDCVRLFAYTRESWPRTGRSLGSGGPLAGLEVNIGPKGKNASNSIKHIPVWTDYDSPEELKLLIMQRPCGPVGDETILKKWINACLRDHPACRIPTPGTEELAEEAAVTLPSFVVDIGSAAPFTDPVLVETQGLKGRYAALSHCWGQGKATMTLKQNLQDHMVSIPMQKLCANFQHAVEVGRKLGFQYLWIDSLCIIQDDPAHWETESAKMADVYSHASLVLSAANSSSADEGFLKTRSPLRTVTLPVNYIPGTVVGHITIAEQTSDEIYRDEFRHDVEHGPLAKRGWTLQERLLARRNIFFGREEFHWECRSARWSESTDMRPIRYVDVSAGLAAFRGLPLFGPHVDGRGGSQLLNDWYMLVQEFAKRSLTKKDTDNLPALSGMAKVIESAFRAETQTVYCAGLWSHDLPRGILWKSFGPEFGGSSVLPGPSWSWISQDARIFPAREEAEAAVDISNITWDVTLAGTDTHGAVAKGILTLEGYIKEVPSIKLIPTNNSTKSSSCPYPLSNALIYDHMSQQIGAVVLDDPADKRLFAEKLYAVPVRHLMATFPSIRTIQALLLQEASKGEYRRVGVVDMLGSNANDARCKGAPFAAPLQVFFYDAPKEKISIV